MYGYIWKFFKDEQKAAAGGKAGDTIDVWGSVVKMSDWRIFSKHSFYLLLSGYCGVADQQINTILISRMGSVDLAGNSLIGTMMSYPYIFAGAFGTVISTLGSKYIGQRDDWAYLKLGLVMIVLSAGLGVSLGFVVIFFASEYFSLHGDSGRCECPSLSCVYAAAAGDGGLSEAQLLQRTCCTFSRMKRTSLRSSFRCFQSSYRTLRQEWCAV